MPMNLQCRQGQAGLSLLEVLIATVVLSAGLLGLAGLQVAGLKSTHNSYQMQQATWLARDLLERMRANKPGVYAGNYSATTTCGTAPTSCATGTCTNAQMAAYDLYDVRCGYTNGTTNSGGVKNLLMNGALTVSCPTGTVSGGNPSGCASGIPVQVSVQWNERNASHNTAADTTPFTITLNALL